MAHYNVNSSHQSYNVTTLHKIMVWVCWVGRKKRRHFVKEKSTYMHSWLVEVTQLMLFVSVYKQFHFIAILRFFPDNGNHKPTYKKTDGSALQIQSKFWLIINSYLLYFIGECLVLYQRKRVFHHLTYSSFWSFWDIRKNDQIVSWGHNQKKIHHQQKKENKNKILWSLLLTIIISRYYRERF